MNDFGLHQIVEDAPIRTGSNGTYRWNGLGYRTDGPNCISVTGYEYYKVVQLILPEPELDNGDLDRIQHRMTQNQWHIDINPNGVVQVRRIDETNWCFV